MASVPLAVLKPAAEATTPDASVRLIVWEEPYLVVVKSILFVVVLYTAATPVWP